MAGTTSEADVVMNRINVALARSQRLINSWLPPKPNEEEGGTAQAREEREEDFKPMTEKGGIGSLVAFGEEGLPDGAFRRNKLSSNDKLLEQLIGKKAARAKRKSQEVGKSMAASRHAAPKPLVNRPRQLRVEPEGEEEDEPGRAGMFKSRKNGKAVMQCRDEHVGDDDPAPAISSEPDERPAKKKTGGYLDELLAQKAKKKKGKKGKHRQTADA